MRDLIWHAPVVVLDPAAGVAAASGALRQ